ncbi:OmpH family outer membrane protein [Compostibacter hankyongensis]|uniref:OmpH family outer membrane protein n=1 Tax=Compostibacter hankyongensis TaxID=1007089 RepID=A0ABP8FTJ8_9BACT
MKKLLFLCCILAGLCTAARAQRYCVIDSKSILEKVPEYQDAQKKLDDIAAQWQKEIDARFKETEQLYKSYQSEQVMLTADLKKKRQDEIMQKEKAARDLQEQRFGYEGDLFKKRQELVKPIQDKIYNAVQKLAAQHMYDFVLDKAGGITLFYADPKLDKTEDVLKILGIKK